MALPEASSPPGHGHCRSAAPSRRGVLTGLGLSGLTTIVGSASITMTGPPAYASPLSDGESILVVVSLRGAADGLSLVVPHGDPVYYTARPTIAVPRSQLLCADPMFGLHPALGKLAPMWDTGELAVVNATGLPVANRSHFAAIEEVEDAQVGSATRSGWLNRLLGDIGHDDPATAITMGTTVAPTSMYGTVETLGVRSFGSVQIPGDDPRDARRTRRTTIERMWESSTGAMAAAVDGAMDVVDSFTPALAAQDTVSRYPATDLGRTLAMLARSIRGGVDVRLATVDSGSWDMHTNLGTVSEGALVRNATDLAGSLSSFFADLGPHRSRVTVLTISEFGRRVQENSARGLDHGWGNAMFLLGAGVIGGKFHGRWPGLQNTLDADLPVTTDYRSVLSECVASRFPAASLRSVFPGFRPERVGVMASA